MLAIEGAVIAAAGLGSRLGMGLPKCMLEIDGTTILSRLIGALQPLVGRIHVVVGYREELVIEHCSRFHRNVVIVRNPDYRTTNTASSMSLGARGIAGKALFLDGDLLVEPASLERFVARAAAFPTLVGITPSTSDQAVFVETTACDELGQCQVKAFGREHRQAYEWANVVAAHPGFVDGAQGFVFQQLERDLPLEAQVINLAEVDTPDDLVRARAFIRGVEAGR